VAVTRKPSPGLRLIRLPIGDAARQRSMPTSSA
jgi:hypothetical protein